MEKTDCIVIGAGVVGLAIARALAMAGREVVIIEAEDAIGTHTSSRNTGCIHAGIGYVPGSLKSRLALRGKEMLYDYAATHGVGHRRCGKMIVATNDAQTTKLEAHRLKAESNGLFDLRMLDAGEVREMEPELVFKGVLYSPSSGIVDAHDLMLALLGDAEAHGASLALRSPVISGRTIEGGIELSIGGTEQTTIQCNLCINAAGIGAQGIARTIDGIPATTIPGQVLVKGCFFVLHGKAPFSRLIYPLPDAHHLAVHVSPDMGGQMRFGPDTEDVDKIDYWVDPARASFFYDAARLFWPALKDGDLEPGYAGIRPKTNPGRAADNDFIIQGPDVHGVNGLIALYGIESPGLTSSLAIGEYVAGLAKGA
ncbi:MAG: NAD(P)/FAD-dependent oxidoreductase [Alphaproteobacteria bacterium]|jgi:L-2-hydroxyglutarate oxidase LhgO